MGRKYLNYGEYLNYKWGENMNYKWGENLYLTKNSFRKYKDLSKSITTMKKKNEQKYLRRCLFPKT